MSFLLCCAGGKQRRHPKKSSSPADRKPVEPEQKTRQDTAIVAETEVQQSEPVSQSFGDDMTLRTDNSLVETSLPYQSNTQPTDKLMCDNKVESKLVCDDSHESLNKILAHLMNDISSPSFQRSYKKTDENMNIHEEATDNGDNSASLSVQPTTYQSDINDDYDIPCGNSDDGISELERMGSSEYDVPPVSRAAAVLLLPHQVSTTVVGEIELNTKENEGDEAITRPVDIADYDMPRPLVECNDEEACRPRQDPRDGDVSDNMKATTVRIQITSAETQDAESQLKDHETGNECQNQSKTIIPCNSVCLPGNNSDNGPCLSPLSDTSFEMKISVSEQFKAARLEVLTTISQLLKTVASSEDTVQTKIQHISALSSNLKTSLINFVRFVRLQLDKVNQPESEAMAAKIQSLIFVQNGIDEFLKDMDVNSNNSVAKLAQIIHLTKGIPGILRTFTPLIESVSAPTEVKLGPYGNERDNVFNDKFENTGGNLKNNEQKIQAKPPSSKSESEEVRHTLNDHFISNGNTFDNAELGGSSKGCKQDSAVHVFGGDKQESVIINEVTVTQQSHNVEPPSLPRKHKIRTSTEMMTEIVAASVGEGLQPAISQIHNEPDKIQTSGSLSISQYKRNDGELLVLLTADNDDQPVMRDKSAATTRASNDDRISESQLETPDIRTSGVSQTTADQLDELRRQADSQNVLMHTEYLPTNKSSENTVGGNQLSTSDRRLLMFYCSQMSSNWTVLDNAAGAFFTCMQRKQLPKVFVTHSRFVILAGHKMIYIGDLLAKNIEDSKAQDYIITYSNSLCDCLKMAVRATREAVLKFPDIQAQQLMVDSIKEVTDWSLELKEVIDRLTYTGQPEHLLS